MAREPLVSVIVPVWNEKRRIDLCLDALAVQSLGRDRYEVIVVDNGSTDGTVALLRTREADGKISLLEEPAPGSYAARNRGLAAARGRWIAFTDGDCVPEPGWLEAALAAAKADPEVGVVAGRIRLFLEADAGSRACADHEQLFAFDQASNVSRQASVTANWLSPRAALGAAGGFDARIRSGGDFQLARKISALGRPVVFAPDAVVGHPVRANFNELRRKCRRVVGGHWTRERRPVRLFWVAGIGAKTWAERSIRAATARRLSLHRRLGVLAVAGSLGLTWQVETLRLLLGGEPVR